MNSRQTSKSTAHKKTKQVAQNSRTNQEVDNRQSITHSRFKRRFKNRTSNAEKSSSEPPLLKESAVSSPSPNQNQERNTSTKVSLKNESNHSFKTRRCSPTRVARDAYLRNKVKTASGGELVIMLYEKAISNLSIACELLGQTDATPDVFLEAGANIRNAKEIILELLYSLDLETGGEFARKVSGIYGFMNRELTEALIEKTDVRLKPIIEQLKILLEAWRKAHEQLKSQERLDHPHRGDLQIGP